MAAPSFRAGSYSVSFDSQLMGYTEIGFEEIKRPSANILRLDPTGRTPIDALWTGVEDIIVRIESMEWSDAIWAKAIPWLHEGGNEGVAEKAGQLIVAGGLAKQLVLTPVTGNLQPAYTYGKAYPIEPVRSIFSSQRVRPTPMGFFIFATDLDTDILTPTLYTVS